MSAAPSVERLERKLSPECECGGPKYIGAEMCQPCRTIFNRTHPAKPKPPTKPALQLVAPDVDDDAALNHCPRDRAHRIVERVRGPWCPSCQGFLYRRLTLDGELVLAVWRPKP